MVITTAITAMTILSPTNYVLPATYDLLNYDDAVATPDHFSHMIAVTTTMAMPE